MGLLDARAAKATELAATLRELSDLQSELIRAAAAVYNRGRYDPTVSITNLREDVKHATSEHRIEELKAIGEIDALRVELAHIDTLLRYDDARNTD